MYMADVHDRGAGGCHSLSSAELADRRRTGIPREAGGQGREAIRLLGSAPEYISAAHLQPRREALAPGGGVSLHVALRSLVMGGMTPAEALQTATIRPHIEAATTDWTAKAVALRGGGHPAQTMGDG